MTKLDCSLLSQGQPKVISYTTRMPWRLISHLQISGKIIKNVKYRSRAPGQVVRLKGMSRTSTQSFTFTATFGAKKIKLT